MADQASNEDRKGPSEEEIMQAVPQGEAGREVRLGIFVVLGLLSFVMLLFLLTDPATFRGRYVITTEVQNAGGIRNGDPIQMLGVNIGRISNFEMTDDGTVEIDLEIEGEWQIPEDSRTRMGGAGLFGGRTLEVVRGDAREYLDPGDRIPGEGDSSDPLAQFNELGGQAETVLERIEVLLDGETVESVQGSARNLETLLAELGTVVDAQQGRLDELTRSLARSAQGLEEAAAAGPDAARAVARADSLLVVLRGTSENLDAASSSLGTILARMESGEGTLGRLSVDSSLYDNLNEAAARMAALALDVQENPERYIRLSLF